MITAKGAGFRSLHDTWADTTTAHGRLMLTVLGGLAEFEREFDPRPHRQRARPRRGERRPAWPKADAHRTPEAGGHQAPRWTIWRLAL
jgi:DNA invertase Pin-like site-specific DNA recombinase